jgi:hypothetical protein
MDMDRKQGNKVQGPNQNDGMIWFQPFREGANQQEKKKKKKRSPAKSLEMHLPLVDNDHMKAQRKVWTRSRTQSWSSRTAGEEASVPNHGYVAAAFPYLLYTEEYARGNFCIDASHQGNEICFDPKSWVTVG